MHAENELPIAISLQPEDCHPARGPTGSRSFDTERKYALLLKYSGKARAAESRVCSLSLDLRDQYRREAVTNPARIDEIAARFLAEEQRRRSPFGDPDLDVLYLRLGSHCSGAQAEFRQVVALLGEEIDPEEVYGRIAREYPVVRRPSFNRASERLHEKAMESFGVTEEYRRLAAQITDEIQELRREVEARFLPVEPQIPAATDDQLAIRSSNRARAANELRKPTARSAATGRPKWGLAFASATAAVAVLAGGGLAVTTFPGANEHAKDHVVADQRQAQEQEEHPVLGGVLQAVQAEAAPQSTTERASSERAETEDRGFSPTVATTPGPMPALIAPQTTEPASPAVEAREIPATQVGNAAESTSTLASESQRQPRATSTQAGLSTEDCKRLQAALTSVGYETPTTGYFGPITRSGIAAWQKAQGLPPTGLVDSTQMAALFAQATVAARKLEQAKVEARAAEAALALSEDGRKLVQAALSAAGHVTPVTGYFGPITRANIAVWQQRHGLPATGYLSDRQLVLLRSN